MRIATKREASGRICETAINTRQPLVKPPDTKASNNRERTVNAVGDECEMSHFILLLLLLVSIRWKSMSHTEELSIVLIGDRKAVFIYTLLKYILGNILIYLFLHKCNLTFTRVSLDR